MMNNITKIINAYWFKSAICGGIGIVLLLNGLNLWAGVAFGFGAKEFLEYFKSTSK
jgi:hypothetical protein